MKTGMLLTAVLCCASIVPMAASADPWEVRREMREGARNVAIERREAAHEIQRCKTRDCVLRETREGHREVNRERREARHEIRRERTPDYYYQPARYDHDARYYGGDGRYYSNDRYYGANHSAAHYHPDGHYCRDANHIAHLRDSYYRGDRRWYRDNRYWNEPDYVGRYYGGRNRYGANHNDNDDLVRGIVIGAAVVGVIAAIHEANDGD